MEFDSGHSQEIEEWNVKRVNALCDSYYTQYRGVVIEVSGCVGKVYLALGLTNEEQK